MPARVVTRRRQTLPHQTEAARALAKDLQRHRLELALHMPSALPAPIALEWSPVPLALLNPRGIILSAGKPLFELFGVSAEKVLFHGLAEFLAEPDPRAFLQFLVRCGGARQTRRAEFLMAGKDQPPRRVLLIIAPLPAADPLHTLFHAAFVDLTETEAPDFAPRQSQQDARLIEVIDGIVWEADYPMRFTFVSRQAERILGYPAPDWLRDPDFWEKHIYHEDRERVLQNRAQAVRQLAHHVLEYRMVTADRRLIWVKDSAVIVADAPGWTRISGIITDVTDLEHAREKLKHANETLEAAVAERTAKMEQSLRAMETVCYGIAHDMKAPLRGLQGFIDILVTDYQKAFDATARDYADRCQTALRRMGELIEAVLAYGRLNHTVPELLPVQIKPIVTRVLQSLETDIKQKHAKIDLQLRFPKVLGNPYLLEQVFNNLISNAIKFTAPGVPPEISVSATQADSPSACRGEASERSRVRLTISDNGIGISPEFVKRMFGMFQKFHPPTEYAGSGIGLAIVKRAVELMNGRLGVLSDPGHGSSFWIELPLASNSD